MIYLTGSSGFVGSSLINSKLFDGIIHHRRGFDFNFINITTVLHLAGKAHDLKYALNYEEYSEVNTELTKFVFDAFLASDAKVFITLSSVKAVADQVNGELKEQHIPNPVTFYGKSKLLAEQYILSKKIPKGKRVYVLRPCMIHGPGNKGNLNLLYLFASKGLPWPLGAFDNLRSFCSIDNLLFVLKELIDREDIPSGVYNIADEEPLSTNEIIKLIAISQGKTAKIWKISKMIVFFIAKLGDFIHLPLNSESLQKLTESYVICIDKLTNSLAKPLPISSREGLCKTFKSFNSI